MTKPLSERLAEAIETVCENGMDTRDIVSLFRESEAFARRVEGAPSGVLSRSDVDAWMLADSWSGQRVRLVPEVDDG